MSEEKMTTQEEKPQAAQTAPVSDTTKAETKKKATKATKGKKKAKKKVRQVSNGQVHIKATYNNTIVTFTDLNGNVLAQSSAGAVGFKGPKKSTPYAASVIVKEAAEKVQEMYGLNEVAVFVKGVGSGREGALRALNTHGFNVVTLKDVTPIPHNGCRPKKVRRV